MQSHLNGVACVCLLLYDCDCSGKYIGKVEAYKLIMELVYSVLSVSKLCFDYLTEINIDFCIVRFISADVEFGSYSSCKTI